MFAFATTLQAAEVTELQLSDNVSKPAQAVTATADQPNLNPNAEAVVEPVLVHAAPVESVAPIVNHLPEPTLHEAAAETSQQSADSTLTLQTEGEQQVMPRGASILPPTQTTLNQPSGKFKFNVVTDSMIDALNNIAPQDAAANELTLDTFHLMIAAAVAKHPEMRAAGEQTKVAGYVSTEAFSAYLPQVSATVDAGSRLSRSSTSTTLLPKGSGLNVTMSLKQLLYDFGATGANYDAAKYREKASAERLATKRSELGFRTISAYIELLRARQLYRLAEANFDSRLSIVDMMKERYELGGGSKVDVIRAEARLTDANATKISAAINLQMAEAGYKEMFIEDPAATPMPQDVSVALADQPIDELSKKYGAVRETEQSLLGLRADAKAAQSRMLPTLNLELNGARREQDTYYGDYDETSAHLVMRYNLFAGGAENARKQQAVHRADQLQQDLDNLVLQVKKSIMQSTTQVNEAEGLLNVRRQGVLGASQSLLAVKEHFTYRRGSLLDLLRSQEELYIAGRDFISAIMDRSIARYRLLHLTAVLETMIPELNIE